MPEHCSEGPLGCTLFGIPLDPHTSTHGPCQVSSCDVEWAVATSSNRFDSTEPERRQLCLCNGHSRLFRELSKVDKRALRKYREALPGDDNEQC